MEVTSWIVVLLLRTCPILEGECSGRACVSEVCGTQDRESLKREEERKTPSNPAQELAVETYH